MGNIFRKIIYTLIHSYIDALVVTFPMVIINQYQILIIIHKLIDILFYKTWKQIKLFYPLKLVTNALVGFSGLSSVLKGS